MGRKKKDSQETTIVYTTTSVISTIDTSKLDPHQPYTKLVRHNPKDFSKQYDRLIASGWVLIEVKGNVYLFERG